MAARIPALVNPPLLVWAREEAGYSLEAAAERTGFPVEKLHAWETDAAKPTLRQAQALAKAYHRPFGVFFLPQPPSLPPLAAEYRRLPGVQPGVESPELRLAIRIMSQRREIALQLSEELGIPVTEFATSLRLTERPTEAGSRLRGFTHVPSDKVYWQHGHSTERDFIYVTTQNLSHDQLQALSDEVGEHRSLLVICAAFRGKADRYTNVTIKKIPKGVMALCEWGKDDYSVRIENLPKAPPPTGQQGLEFT
jgi:transcriptional regulator with XRE-family HTH domain